MPQHMLISELDGIRAWARDPGAPFDLTLARPLPDWLARWFSRLTFNRQVMFLIALFSPLIVTMNAALERRAASMNIKSMRVYLPLYAWIYLGLIYWLISAPDIRFGYGVLVLLFLMMILLVLRMVNNLTGFTNRAPAWIIVGLLVLYQGSVLVRSIDMPSLPQRLIVPADYLRLPYKPCELYNTRIWCSDGYYECWYEPFPCVYAANPRVGLRGKDLQAGFRYFYED